MQRHSRESGNLGSITQGPCLRSLDARLRGYDGIKPLKITMRREIKTTVQAELCRLSRDLCFYRQRHGRIPSAWLRSLEYFVEFLFQGLRVERLDDIVVHAGLDGFHDIFLLRLGGHHEHGGVF